MSDYEAAHHGEQEQVIVGLDYETDMPWVWVVDDPEREAEGYTTQFAVNVPAVLVEEFRAVNKRQDELVEAIHHAAGFDRVHARLGEAPCCDYVGEPLRLSDRVVYDDCEACGWAHEEHDHG